MTLFQRAYATNPDDSLTRIASDFYMLGEVNHNITDLVTELTQMVMSADSPPCVETLSAPGPHSCSQHADTSNVASPVPSFRSRQR